MKTLIIIRHGENSRDNPTLLNSNTPLSRVGKREVGRMAGRFTQLEIAPHIILSSPALHAVETAQIFGKKIGLPADRIRVEQQLFEAEKWEITQAVKQLSDAFDTVLLVGHNPAVSELRAYLTGTALSTLKMADCVVLQLTVDRWCDTAFGKAEQVTLIEPGAEEPLSKRLKDWLLP